MALRGFSAVLLVLGLAVSYVNGDGSCDSILNVTAPLTNTTGTAFNLTVSPTQLTSNATYTVNVTGNGNFTVLLQAINVSTPVGSWSSGANTNCAASAVFVSYSLNSTGLQSTWTSPANVTNVTINAYFSNGNNIYRLQQNLAQATTTTPAPTTNSTAAVAVTSTTKSSGKTTIDKPSLLIVVFGMVLSLLLNPSKHHA